ncbi:MAG: SlyX family protein [Hyphomicrobiales bacterium]|nr:SlyX family protein [Hyphomicrobiales bacterium]
MIDPVALESRIEHLETRVAFQDRTIEDLNKMLTAQWQEIDKLKRELAKLGEQLKEAQFSSGPSAPEPPPPHY